MFFILGFLTAALLIGAIKFRPILDIQEAYRQNDELKERFNMFISQSSKRDAEF